MELLPTMIVKVELFAGTDIDDAAHDMCRLAGRIGVLCEAPFNGVKLWARPGDNPAKLVEAFHTELQSKRPYKIAQARDVNPARPV